MSPATASAAIELTEFENDAKRWVPLLAQYRAPSLDRSLFELALTLAPYAALVALSAAVFTISPWLAGGIAVINSLFLVRVFMIQHDCGHGAFFASRAANDWTGRILGVVTLTPYDVWRQTHSIHHSAVGDLDRRGIGDLSTLTVREFRELSAARKLIYRIYRNPAFLFGFAPAYLFLVQNRLPVGLMNAGRKYWVSVLATNSALFAVLAAAVWVAGPALVSVVFLPTALVGASIGVWLFYVQHQFEDTYWQREPDWSIHEAALHGSSFYVLPPVLRWFAANIGMHHVHHLCSRIPFYRLGEVIEDHPELGEVQRLTLIESLMCARLHLWDEDKCRLVTFSAAQRAGYWR